MIIEQILTSPEVWACLAVIGTIIAVMTTAYKVLVYKMEQA